MHVQNKGDEDTENDENDRIAGKDLQGLASPTIFRQPQLTTTTTTTTDFNALAQQCVSGIEQELSSARNVESTATRNDGWTFRGVQVC